MVISFFQPHHKNLPKSSLIFLKTMTNVCASSNTFNLNILQWDSPRGEQWRGGKWWRYIPSCSSLFHIYFDSTSRQLEHRKICLKAGHLAHNLYRSSSSSSSVSVMSVSRRDIWHITYIDLHPHLHQYLSCLSQGGTFGT